MHAVKSRRFEIYTYIHKALRAQMSQVLVHVGRVDWDDAGERDAALTCVRELLAACLNHQQLESTYIHPALELAKARSSMLAESDHRMHGIGIDTLLNQCLEIELASTTERTTLAEQLYGTLGEFISDCLEHMAYEERDHHRLLWASFEDDELQSIHHVILLSMPHALAMQTLSWMIPNLLPRQRIEVIGGLRRSAPTDFFEAVMSMLRSTLRASEWSRLSLALHSECVLGAANDDAQQHNFSRS